MTTKEYLLQLPRDITGGEIAEIRNELGLTQEELAWIFGVHPQTVSRWERGESGPEAGGAVRFALEFFKLCDQMLKDEVFSTLDERIDEMTALREKIRRDRAQTRAMLDKYEAELPPAPPVA